MTTTPTLWRAAQQANTTDSGVGSDDQTIPQFVGLANGNVVALWESNTDTGAGSANGTDIVGQLYSAEGAKIGAEFRANNSFFADDEGDFTAAALPNGNFVVAFEDTDSDGTAIRYSILGPTGTAVANGTIGSDPGVNQLGTPSIAVNSDGSFLVVFQNRDPGNSVITQGTIVSSAGVAGAPTTFVTGSADFGAGGQQTGVATLTNGNYAVVSRHLSGGDASIVLTVRNAAGGTVVGASFVSATNTNGQADVAPAVASLSSGGFVVAWQNTDSSDTDIRFQRFDAAGSAVSGIVTVNGGATTDNNRAPKLVGLSDGGFVIVYDDNEANKIALQRYSASGAEVGEEVTVATTGGPGASLSQPTVSLTDDGRLLVGWTSTIQTFDPVGFDNDVRFAIFDPRETVINGDGSANVITARKGGATVNGLGGADTLLGQGAADTLNGGDGDDTIRGGGGADLIQGGLNQDTIFGDEGNDTIYANTQDSPDGSITGDTISGGNGNDTLRGSNGADQLNGDADNDSLDGGGGADTMTGGSGNDTYRIDNSGDRLFEAAGGGSDTVLTTISYRLADGQEIEALQAADAAGTGKMTLVGNAFAQTLTGNAGANTLDGAAGADTLIGLKGDDLYRIDNGGDRVIEAVGGGEDTVLTAISHALTAGQEIEILATQNDAGTAALNLFGNGFANTIRGNAGNNLINGKEGTDVLTGGAGADTFVFDTALTATNVDRITDFAPVDDTIRLSKAVFTAIATGPLAASAFKDIATVGRDADDRILYDSRNGKLFYDVDGSGSTAAVQIAVLDNRAAITHADFLIA